MLTSRGLVQRAVWTEGVSASQALLGHRPCCWGSQKIICWRHYGFEPAGRAGASRCSRSPAPRPSATPAETVWPNWSMHGECSGPCPPPGAPSLELGQTEADGFPAPFPSPGGTAGNGCWASRAKPLARFQRALHEEVATAWPRFSVLFGDRSLPSPWRWARKACLAGHWQGQPRGDVRSSQVQAQTCG